jgi:endonuclease-8
VIKPRGQLPKTQRSLRVALHTEHHSALLYSASDIAVLDEAQLAEHPFLRKLGPDALDPATTPAAVLAQLCSARFVKRTLASLYLDQSFLAGIGNYLRSEILFAAGLHPRSKPLLMSPEQLQRLAELSLSVTRLAYRKAGVINPQAAALRARGYSREAARFLVFNRDGLPCYHCGRLIQREEIGARRLYHCTGCQPLPGSAADF